MSAAAQAVVAWAVEAALEGQEGSVALKQAVQVEVELGAQA